MLSTFKSIISGIVTPLELDYKVNNELAVPTIDVLVHYDIDYIDYNID